MGPARAGLPNELPGHLPRWPASGRCHPARGDFSVGGPSRQRGQAVDVGVSSALVARGEEIIHGFDIRRMAITDLSGLPSLLPEWAGADESLSDIQIDVSTGRLAALYSHSRQARSAVVIASVPSGRLITRVDLPVRARAPHFSGESVFVVLSEKQHVVGLVSHGAVLRHGVPGDGLLVDVSPWKNGRFITVGLPMFSLSIKDPDGRERVIASSQHIGRLSPAQRERGL